MMKKKLLKQDPKEFLDLKKSLKDHNITFKIGVSIYTLKNLKLILKKFDIDLIQLPANVFDKKRFLNKKLLKIFKKKEN